MEKIIKEIGMEGIVLSIWLMWSWVFALLGRLIVQKRMMILFSLIAVLSFFCKEISWSKIWSGESDYYISNIELSIIIIILVFLYGLFQQEEETDSWMFIVFCLMLWSFFVWIITEGFLYYLICFEILSWSFFFFAFYRNKNNINLNSVAEYSSIMAISLVCLLFSWCGLYYFSGSLSYIDWRHKIIMLEGFPEVFNEDLWMIKACSLVLFFSLSFKWYLYPRNDWIIDCYETCDKIRIVVVGCIFPVEYLLIFLKLYTVIFSYLGSEFCIILGLCGFLTFNYSILHLIGQFSIRRLIGCCTLNHLGSFICLDCLTEGLLSKYTFYYIVCYISNMVFLIHLLQNVQTTDGKSVERIFLFSGLFKEQPLIGIGCSITMFSWGGFTPYWGFLVKIALTGSYSYSVEGIMLLFLFLLSLLCLFCFWIIIHDMFVFKVDVKIVYKGGVKNSILFSVLTLLNVMSLFFIFHL